MVYIGGSNTTFVEDLENLVWELDVSYMDSIIEYCKRRGIEEESVASVVKKDAVLMAKLEQEALELRLLRYKKGAKLPL